MQYRSIKRKLIKSTSLMLFSVGLLTVVAILFLTYRQVDEQRIHDFKELSQARSSRISIFLEEVTNLSAHIAAFPQVQTWALNPDEENTRAALHLFNDLNINQRYLAIYILNDKGEAIISTDPTLLGNNYSFRPYFKKAIKGQANMDMAIGATTLAQGYYFANPIRSESGQIIGVLAMKMSPQNLYDVMDFEARNDNSNIMLTDQYGVIIYSDEKERMFHSLGKLSEPTLKQITDDRKFLGLEIKPIQYEGAQSLIIWPKSKESSVYKFYDTEDQKTEIIAVTPIEGYPLFLISEDDAWQFSLGAIKLATISGFLVLLAILIVILILSTLITKYIQPVNELTEMIKYIGRGQKEVKNKINSRDEFEQLGNFISETAKELHNYYGNLEEKVKQRTQELARKNESLNQAQTAIINILEDAEEEKNHATELASNLEKFKLALDNASDHIVITDPEGIVLYGNAAVERITGYKLKEALGKKAGTLWKYPMDNQYYKNLWDTLKIKKQTFISEITNKRKNGEIYEALISLSPVLNENNEIAYIVGIERDITKEKLIDKAKTEFVSLASHQLRTPLSGINWYAEMLLAGDGGKLSKEAKEFVKEIYESNQRMVELVNSLLNVSRLEMGTFAVEPTSTDTKAIAESVLKELKPEITQKKLAVSYNYDPALPIIQADPKLMRIVLQNLLANAVKYTPEKGKISLDIKSNKKNILIEVADTGYGIPKKDQMFIFKKLFRAANVKAKDVEGTGLGLYIVKMIIEHAGGKIDFKSEENKGTTFFIEIPLTGMKKKEGLKRIE